MALFSERYGYLNPREVIIREEITEPVLNSILNWLEIFYSRNALKFKDFDRHSIEKHIWMFFFNKRGDLFYKSGDFIKKHLLDNDITWYKKLDLIEMLCTYTSIISPKADMFIDFLNGEFERHNFAYRVVKNRIVEITSKDEIEAIDKALTTSVDGVKTHLQTALKLMSASQGKPDYRNSIKESISAVECLCRNITGENTLGKALQQLESKGVSINSTLKSAFEKLYGYTNNADTGVRHALMDDANAPTSAEALYMLVTCSAFINYVNTKMQQTNG